MSKIHPAVTGSGIAKEPLVSVGVPVFNDGQFIDQALSDIVGQDYTSLEIIISDNASTDSTEEICRRFAEQDTRIHYHRFPTNQGAVKNINRIYDLSSGKYFKLASGHDRYSKNLISACVELMENHPTAAIAFGSADWIDEFGEPYDKESGHSDTRGLPVVNRYFTVLMGNLHPILGLMRMAYFKKGRVFRSVTVADLVVLTELALMGDFIQVNGASWSRREFRGKESHQERLKRYQSKEFNLTQSLVDRLFPYLKLPFFLLGVILRANISRWDKFLILIILGPAMFARYFTARK